MMTVMRVMAMMTMATILILMTRMGVLMPLPSVSGHVCPILTECTLAGRGPKPGCF